MVPLPNWERLGVERGVLQHFLDGHVGRQSCCGRGLLRGYLAGCALELRGRYEDSYGEDVDEEVHGSVGVHAVERS